MQLRSLLDLWRHQDLNLWDILKFCSTVTNFWGKASDPLKWGKTNFTATGTAVFSPGWIGSTSQMRKLTHVQAPWGLGPRAGPAHITQTVDKKKRDHIWYWGHKAKGWGLNHFPADWSSRRQNRAGDPANHQAMKAMKGSVSSFALWSRFTQYHRLSLL